MIEFDQVFMSNWAELEANVNQLRTSQEQERLSQEARKQKEAEDRKMGEIGMAEEVLRKIGAKDMLILVWDEIWREGEVKEEVTSFETPYSRDPVFSKYVELATSVPKINVEGGPGG